MNMREEEGDGGQDPNLRGYKYQRSEESTVRLSRDESKERRKRIFIPTNSYQFEVDIPRSLSRSSMTKPNQQP